VRLRLTCFSLPSAYNALGNHILGEGSYRNEFGDIYQRLDALRSKIETLSRSPASEPRAEGLGRQVAEFAKRSWNRLHARELEFRLSRVVTELGQAAFENHGEASGPPHLVKPIMDSRAGLQGIDAEIDRLRSNPSPGPTPAATSGTDRISIWADYPGWCGIRSFLLQVVFVVWTLLLYVILRNWCNYIHATHDEPEAIAMAIIICAAVWGIGALPVGIAAIVMLECGKKR
jgi:hypothetical protein